MPGIDATLEMLQRQKSDSETKRSQHEAKWARAIKICKGIFLDGETTSKVRNVKKIYYRKIWSSIWRLVATMYQSFLKDKDNFNIEGRDMFNDPHKAKVLQKIVEYRRDQLDNRNALFIKMIWAFWDIFKYGVCYGKLAWIYREDKDGRVIEDRPDYVAYPPEQVFPDMSAVTKDKMRYVHFLNYMTKEELESLGVTNIDAMEERDPSGNQVRETRHAEGIDPLQSPGMSNDYGSRVGGEYPSAGKYEDGSKDSITKFYHIYESFWMENGKMMFGLHNDFKVFAIKNGKKEKKLSPYGDEIPLIMGLCLTEPHQLIGEGFTEAGEAPQESYNYFLNMRKDNIAKAMTGHTFVERDGDVDIKSLLKRRVNGYTLVGSLNAVKHEDVPDVTRSAYVEASQDEAMMDDLTGDTKANRGMQEPEIKATTAQLNYAQSNIKIDLYIAMVGKTFMSNFYNELTRQIQLFENDITVMRVANERFRQEEGIEEADDIYDVGFEADCIINIGVGAAGREMEIKQTFLAMDRGIMAMQAISGLMQMGVSPPGGFEVPNLGEMFKDLLPKIGKKDLKRYLIKLPPIQPQEGGGGGNANPDKGTNMTVAEEMIQGGGGGGF